MPSILNHLALLECLSGDWDGAARSRRGPRARPRGRPPADAGVDARQARDGGGAAGRGRRRAGRGRTRTGARRRPGGGARPRRRDGDLDARLPRALAGRSGGGGPAAAPLVDALLARGRRAGRDALPSRRDRGPGRARPAGRRGGARPGRRAAAASCSRRAANTRRRWRRSSRPPRATSCRSSTPARCSRSGPSSAAPGSAARPAPRSRPRRRPSMRSAPRCGARRHAPSWAGSAGASLHRRADARERRVAELVAAGRTNREVAETLVLSVHTVEAALTQAYRKLGVRSRTELARLYR